MTDNKTFIVPPFKSEPFSRSPVTIIIPFHNFANKVVLLVESIWKFTQSNPYEICLVDDASENKHFIKEMEKLPQVVAFRSEKQLGFGGALKLGFDNTKQPWVVFLHSDCLIETPNWLVEMGNSLLELKSKNVRMISARSNNPGDGDPRLKSVKNSNHSDVVLDGGYLPLYCTLSHRELYARIGGFVKPYFPAVYEDEELAFRMRKHGFKQAICGKSWVRHEGGITINEMCKDRRIVKQIENNRLLCQKDMV